VIGKIGLVYVFWLSEWPSRNKYLDGLKTECKEELPHKYHSLKTRQLDLLILEQHYFHRCSKGKINVVNHPIRLHGGSSIKMIAIKNSSHDKTLKLFSFPSVRRFDK
jgi:hypothetical protein